MSSRVIRFFPRAITVLAIAALGAGVSQAAVPTELAVNGGFETGDLSGWSEFPSGPGQFSVISPGETGNFAGCMQNTVSTSAAVLKNANIGVGTVNPNQLVTITFDARGAGAAGGVAFAEFFSEIDGGGVSSSVLLGGAPLGLNPDPNVWTSFSFMVNAGPDVSGGVTIQFAAVTGADNASTMELYIDNVSVVVDAPVPVEATTWGNLKRDFR